MSSLTATEKRQLEKLYGMASGYVLDFTNRTYHEFVLDAVHRDIFADHYRINSGSKANCLRGFWNHEPDHVVAALLQALLGYGADSFTDAKLVADCERIVARLRQSAPVEDLDALEPNTSDRGFEVLQKSLRDAIANNEPEAALDRLHTFVVKYLRALCRNHGISVEPEKPLHSLLGEYIKAVKSKGLVKSVMTERILKSSISLLDAFNSVRNDQSLAHDNELLSHGEALLIFNSVASTVRFIGGLERDGQSSPDMASPDDLPF